MKLHDIQVSTYSGYKADERPLRFVFKGKMHIIEGISYQTYEEIPDNGLRKVYDVKTDAGRTFKLSYDENQNRWFLEE